MLHICSVLPEEHVKVRAAAQAVGVHTRGVGHWQGFEVVHPEQPLPAAAAEGHAEKRASEAEMADDSNKRQKQ